MKEQIASLQLVRAFAAISVVVLHAGSDLPESVKWQTGHIGVDIFFVLSGFIMWVTTTGNRTSGSDFFLRRVVRIVPLYWTLTLIYGLTPHPTDKPFTFVETLKSLLFIPQYHPIYDGIGGINPVGWTLEVEMLFYVIFALTLSFVWSRRLIVSLLILSALVVSGVFLQSESAILIQFTRSVVGEFGFGLLLGRLFETGRFPKSLALGFGLLGLVVLFIALQPVLPDIRIIHFGLAATCFVGAALAMNHVVKGSFWKPFIFLGNASYSIYLIHFLTFTTSDHLTRNFEHSAPLLALLVYVVMGVAMGALCYLAVEKPLTEAARLQLKKFRKPQTPIKSASAQAA